MSCVTVAAAAVAYGTLHPNKPRPLGARVVGGASTGMRLVYRGAFNSCARSAYVCSRPRSPSTPRTSSSSRVPPLCGMAASAREAALSSSSSAVTASKGSRAVLAGLGVRRTMRPPKKVQLAGRLKSQTLNPKPQTLNPKPLTLNPKP